MVGTRLLLAVICLCTVAHAQATSSPDQVYSFDPKIVHSPVPIQTPDAEMPDQARRQKLGGFCSMALVVDKNGSPQNARVVRCTDPMFAQSSLDVVKRYRFRPATTVQDNKPVLFSMHIDITYKFDRDSDPIPLPRPQVKLEFLLPPQPAASEPDSSGTYILSHAFDPPNSLPSLRRWVGVGFRRAAFALDNGAGCIVALTIHENGLSSDAQITKCDDPSLAEPAMRSLMKSQFSPAMLNGKAVAVHASVRLSCQGFEPLGP